MSSRLNILWIITDEQRTDSIGCYGSSWAHTPALDRLAGNGVRFEHAYTPSPVCISARAALLTGKANSSIGVLSNHHDLTIENPQFLTEEFSKAGYQVASFGKHHYGSKKKAFDIEGGKVLSDLLSCTDYKTDIDEEEYGVVKYKNGKMWEWVLGGRFPGEIEDTPEMFSVREALNWMDERDKNSPYFLRLSFLSPHTPVAAPAPYDTMIDPADIDIPMDSPEEMKHLPPFITEHLHRYAGSHVFTEEEIQRTRQSYYGLAAATDHYMSVLLDELESRGELENTIIAYVSDHGCHLGDQGFYQKQSMFDVSARVPFIFFGAGVANGKVINTPVNITSLLPTLLEAAGLEVPEYSEFKSLSQSVSTGAEPTGEPVFSEIDFGVWMGYRNGDRYVMIRDGKWKLCLFRDPVNHCPYEGDEGILLFNMEEDPGERNNLADKREQKDRIKDLIAKIDTWDSSREIREPSVRGINTGK